MQLSGAAAMVAHFVGKRRASMQLWYLQPLGHVLLGPVFSSCTLLLSSAVIS